LIFDVRSLYSVVGRDHSKEELQENKSRDESPRHFGERGRTVSSGMLKNLQGILVCIVFMGILVTTKPNYGAS